MAELSGIFGDGTFGGSGGTTTILGGLVNPLWPTTITVWGNSSTVVGVNSYWAPPYVNVGDAMSINGINFNYDIVGIISITCLKISPGHQNGYYTGSNFRIGQDFTLNRKINEIWKEDRDWPYHYRQALKIIDTQFWTTDRTGVRYALKYTEDISDKRYKGYTMLLPSADYFTFGSLGKWAQYETDGGTVTNIGSIELVSAITETATSLASCMYVGTQPVCANGYGEFLFNGEVRNQYWNFSKVGNFVYMSSDIGMITETMPTSGYFRQTVGTVLSKDTLYFKPNFCLNTTTVKGFS